MAVAPALSSGASASDNLALSPTPYRTNRYRYFPPLAKKPQENRAKQIVRLDADTANTNAAEG